MGCGVDVSRRKRITTVICISNPVGALCTDAKVLVDLISYTSVKLGQQISHQNVVLLCVSSTLQTWLA